MANETKFGIRKAKPILPVIDLSDVPHKGGVLTVADLIFGPNSYETFLLVRNTTFEEVHSLLIPHTEELLPVLLQLLIHPIILILDISVLQLKDLLEYLA